MAITVTDRGANSVFQANGTTTTISVTNFTPASGAHLVVMFGLIIQRTIAQASFSVGATAGWTVTGPDGTGGWVSDTNFRDPGGGWQTGCALFLGKVTAASPGSGTVTVTCSDATSCERNFWIAVYEVAGAATESWTNLAENAALESATVTATLGTAPAASSLIAGVGLHDGNSVTAEVAVPTGWTETDNTDSTNGGGSWAVGYKNGSGTQGPQWTGGVTDTGSYFAASIVEVPEAGAATGHPARKRMAGVPFASPNLGVW